MRRLAGHKLSSGHLNVFTLGFVTQHLQVICSYFFDTAEGHFKLFIIIIIPGPQTFIFTSREPWTPELRRYNKYSPVP
jgi:hypothetical protein